MYNQRRQFNIFKRLVLLIAVLLVLGACDQSKPSKFQIKEYIENYQIVNKYKVQSFDYELLPNKNEQSGLIRASGQIELSEPLYVEDPTNKAFRKNVAKMMRRNRFTEREIAHSIYDKVIRASTRVPNTQNEYYSFLKKQHDTGLAINFSANLTYRVAKGKIVIDGTVGHAKLKGQPFSSYPHPVVDDSAIVIQAVKNVLAERTKFHERMIQSKGILKQLWDNDHGFILWNRKVPYAGSGELTETESDQLAQLSEWQGIFYISYIKPVIFREPRAADFFELGYYKTEGIATCLKQTGFINQLRFAKSEVDRYCQLGKQYPVYIYLGNKLNAQNVFYTSVTFEVKGISSGAYWHDGSEFKLEDKRFAKYSDQQRLDVLDDKFDFTQYAKPQIVNANLASNGPSKWFALNYFGTIKQSKERKQDALIAKEKSPSASKEVVIQKTPQPAVQASTARWDTKKTVKNSQYKLTKEVQVELKRLNIYTAAIDGIAGKSTVWSINEFQKKHNLETTGKPSEELLATLRATATQPVAAQEAKPDNIQTAKKEEKKRTIVGNVARKTGRAIKKAASWIGSKFKKKDR